MSNNLYHDLDLNKITNIYFIRLGEAQCYVQECINNAELVLDYKNPYHIDCMGGNFDKSFEYYIKEREKNSNKERARGTAKSDLRQIQIFYLANSQSIFITLYKNDLYWCIPEKKITELDDGRKVRKCCGWLKEDLKGNLLTFNTVSSMITRTHAMRGTIAEYINTKDEKRFDYLIKRLSGDELNEVIRIRETKKEYLKAIKDTIKLLHWSDFESLVQSIFLSNGYVENGKGKGTIEDLDLNLINLISNKKLFVQIKAKTNYVEFLKYLDLFDQYVDFQDFLFIYHTTTDKKLRDETEENEQIMNLDKLAELVINTGLVNWVTDKVS